MSLVFTLTFFCAMLQFVDTFAADLSVDTQEKYLKENIEVQHNEILTRKRRYLIFPQGSSFQVVWDGIIGVVDYTNYLILGITVALAWELPSQTPTEVLDSIRQTLLQDNLKTTQSDAATVDSSSYKSNHVWNTNSSSSAELNTFSDRAGYPASLYTNRRIYLNRNESLPVWSNKNLKLYEYNNSKPVKGFKKASVERPTFPKGNKNPVYMRYHRSTRHQLYGKIEKYLERRGIHGHHCVLRALCEKNQRSTPKEKLSFVGALMHAIFSLPEQLKDENVDYRLQRYDRAHEFRGKCDTRYRYCKHSLWTSPYVQ